MRPILIPLDLHERCQIDVLCWWKMYFLTQRKIWDLSTEDPKWDYKFVVYYISVQVSNRFRVRFLSQIFYQSVHGVAQCKASSFTTLQCSLYRENLLLCYFLKVCNQLMQQLLISEDKVKIEEKKNIFHILIV